MATEKKITSRIQQKHDVAANWAKATNFIPKKGEIIIYDAEYNASGEETQAVRFKIGDGSKTVNNLPFAVIDYSSDIETLHQSLDGKQDKLNDAQLTAVNSGITSGKVSTYDGYAALINGKQDKITSSNKLSSSLIDGLGAAAAKAVDTAISANSTSTNLPTSKAVEDRINAHSGIDKVGTVTGVKMNGTTKNPSSGVVDLGTVLTAHQSIKSINTNNTAAQDPNASEAIVGSGTINLHKVAKTGSYNDLSNKPTIPTVNNGTLTIQKNGTTVRTFSANQSTNVTANITVPTKVSEITNDSGYTTNKGTVTSVSVKMNGASKGTVTSSGTIDLGTVVTDVSGKLDKTTYEVNKTIEFGSSGVLYIGKFKVYDTNVTCEVTSTTSVTYSGKLVIATQNNVIQQMTVYGDAANTVAPYFFIKPSTTSDPYIEIYFKPASWSKNVVHIYGSAISAEPTNVCTNVSSVPSTATLKPTNALNSKANLNGGNTFTGTQLIKNATLQLASGAGYNNYLVDCFDRDNASDTIFGVVKTGVDAGEVHIGDGVAEAPILLHTNAGTSGQVLTSQGAGKTPTWTTPPQFTLSGTTLTITV